MAILFDLVYLLLLLVASPWLVWQSLRTGKYRQGLAAKFLGCVAPRTADRPCIWLHAVSVGEVNLLTPLIRELARRRPDCDLYLTTTTQTGFALAQKKYAASGVIVSYCPLDFSWAVRAAMARIRPSLLVLVELELWPNLIRIAHGRGVPIAVVNGRLSDHSFRGYRRISWLIAPLMRRLSVIAVQTAEYAERFLALGAGAGSVVVTGSMKFDGAQTDRHNPATTRLCALAGFAPDDIVFLAGSTQEPEEQLALDTFRQLALEFPGLRLILVPRHPERFAAIAKLLDTTGLPYTRRSALPERSEPISSRLGTQGSRLLPRLLLIDTVGELGAWWGAAQIGFVGGSFGPRGGQNMIEPCAFGVATCFGPNTHNFRDVVSLLLSAGAAEVVPDGATLTTFVRRMLSDPTARDGLAARAKSTIAANLGATERTFALLEPLLPSAPAIQPSQAEAA